MNEYSTEMKAAIEDLPVMKHIDDIIDSVQHNLVTIIVGATGCGKSTQIPRLLYEKMGYNVVVTQPRRVAAISLAERVSKEQILMNECSIGVNSPRQQNMTTHNRGSRKRPLNFSNFSNPNQRVSYAVRFDDRTTEQTKVRYVTDGILLKEADNHDILAFYDVIILDEVHERSINNDMLIGFLRCGLSLEVNRSQQNQSDTRFAHLILMSATMSVSIMREFFEESGDISVRVLEIEGRNFPIKLLYTESPPIDHIGNCVAAVFTEILNHDPAEENGDILVFLPGVDAISDVHIIIEQKRREIVYSLKNITELPDLQITFDSNEKSSNLKILNESVKKLITIRERLESLEIYELYAAMSYDDQMTAIQRECDANSRALKVILSTNIAETSITIPGVTVVIDSGLAKVKFMNTLDLTLVSKTSADQRMGRAGRESPGKCYRVFTQEQYNNLDDDMIPEILRTDLSSVILNFSAWSRSFFDRRNQFDSGSRKDGSEDDNDELIENQIREVVNFSDFRDFPLLSKPSDLAISSAYAFLRSTGAVDSGRGITPYGLLMAELSLLPMWSHLLLHTIEKSLDISLITSIGEGGQKSTLSRISDLEHCIPEILTLVALMSCTNLTTRGNKDDKRVKPKCSFGDHWFYVCVYINCQMQPLCKRLEWCKNNGVRYVAMKEAYDIRKQIKRKLCTLLLDYLFRTPDGVDDNRISLPDQSPPEPYDPQRVAESENLHDRSTILKLLNHREIDAKRTPSLFIQSMCSALWMLAGRLNNSGSIASTCTEYTLETPLIEISRNTIGILACSAKARDQERDIFKSLKSLKTAFGVASKWRSSMASVDRPGPEVNVYKTPDYVLGKESAYIHPESFLFGAHPEVIIATESTKTRRVYMRWCTPVTNKMLTDAKSSRNVTV